MGFGCYSSCLDVLGSVIQAGYTARITICASIEDLHAVVTRKPDFVLLAAKYLPIPNSNNIWFCDYFLENGITFSGSDHETIKFDSDIASAKIHLGNMGIKTARHFTAIPKQFLSQSSLPLAFPLFVKSIDTASSNGIDDLSLVNTFVEFEAKVLSIFTSDKQPALVEEYLAGREFTIAIICNSNGQMTVSSIEMLPSKFSYSLDVFGQKIKQRDTECYMKIEHSVDGQIVNELAKNIFLGLGLRGFGRIDVKMNSYGQCFFMKAKLVPGMTYDKSHFPKACEIANNISYDQVICLMLEECADRAKSDKDQKKVLVQQNLHWPRASVSKHQ